MMRWTRSAAPLLPVAAGLVLLAATPTTCQGPTSGPRQFGEDTLVIPMDECWQPYTNSNNPASGDVEPPGGAGLGGNCSTSYSMGALYAYGLVYNLIAQGVTVYWSINPQKTQLSDVDFSVPGAAQATLYDFSASNAPGAAHGAALASLGAGSTTHECPAAGLCYRGGPFVIDGADFSTVYGLLSSNPAFSQFAHNVQLHVLHPSAAVTVPVNRTLVGTPPKIAILATPDANCFRTAPILDQYLLDAALSQNTAFYQNLYAGDFDIDGGSLANSTLASFNLLWVPHFESVDGTGNYGYLKTDQSKCTASDARLTRAQTARMLSVVGQFVAAGGNLFAECAGIGAMEGDTGYDTQANLSPSTAFLTRDDAGVSSIAQATASGIAFAAPASPFLQIGDFPFTPARGFVGGFVGTYYPAVVELVTDANANDVLDVIPHGAANGDAGTVLYLAGHAYTNYNDPDNNTVFQQNVAGERMVLNTLLSLAATCSPPTADGGFCDTGLPGVCKSGLWQCLSGGLTCVQQTKSTPEVCDGLDNDCDGLVDDNVPPQSCYRSDSGTADCHGAAAKAGDAGYRCGCHPGVQFCLDGRFGVCQGEADPAAEVCNGVDDDCDGRIDNVPDGGEALSEPCYDGPAGTAGVGLCKRGTAVCVNGSYPTCAGEQTPVYGQCDGLDHACIGQPNLCSACQPNQTRPCYSGPSGTLGVGLCRAGTQGCVDGGWALACPGQILPADGGGFCDGLDHACSNQPDVCTACTPGDQRPCYTGASGTQGVGICRGGMQTCSAGGSWGGCVGEVLPAPPTCDGLDNTCVGQADVGAVCPSTLACVNGVCVPEFCGAESNGCPEGYLCQSGTCAVGLCGDGGICGAGSACVDGGCQDPCLGILCGAGSICAGGRCVAGGCTSQGCGDAGLCLQGVCSADPCSGLTCADGTFCRGGNCIQACAFVTCPGGQVCDFDGQCSATPCDGGCSSGQACVNGTCGLDPCAGVGCARGQSCVDGNCLSDPCLGIRCPGLLACVAGQCVDALRDGGSFGGSGGGNTSGGSGATTSSGQGSGAGSTAAGSTTAGSASTTGGPISAKGGCGCLAAGASDPLAAWPALLGLILLTPKRRRRSRPPRANHPTFGRRPLRLAAAAWLGFCACAGGSGPGSTSTGSGNGGSGTTTAIGLIGGNVSSGSAAGTGATTGGAGCVLCGGACVDLASDPAHCGSCEHGCASGEICLFGACGPPGSQAPALLALDPPSGAFGTHVPVTLVGERFSAQTQVLLAGNGLPANDFQPTGFTDSQHLTFTLDLTTLVGGTVQVSAQAPGRLTSAALPFTITAAGSPQLSSVTPGAAPTGRPVALTFAGSDLGPGCAIHIQGGALPDQPIPTSQQTGSAATASWDLTLVPPGNYSFYALNPGARPSNSLSFVVQSVAPVLSDISPTQAVINGRPQLTLDGSGFDASSTALFGPSAATARSQPTTYISSTRLFATVDLASADAGAGAYVLLVQNSGSLRSATQAFTVTTVPAQVSSVLPGQAAAGTQLPIALAGSGFNAGSLVHFQGGGGLDQTLPTTYVNSGALTAQLDLTGRGAGSYQVVVDNPGNAPSAPVGFTVISTAPSLTGLSPAGLAQDTGQRAVTLTGSNLAAGTVVTFTQVSGGTAAFTLPFNAAGDGLSGSVELDPATEPVGDYLVTVAPTGGSASSPVPFAIQPATPTIDSLTPNSSPQTSATLTLCGRYFVAGLTTLHAAGLNSAAAVPAVLGTGAAGGCALGSDQSLVASTDLTRASPGAYTLTVWNGPNLVSASQTFTVIGP